MYSDLRLLLRRSRLIGGLLVTVVETITGEELDLDAAVRHYPLLAVGAAFGGGTLLGWFVGTKLSPATAPPRPMENQLQQLLPESVEKMRTRLPEEIDRVRERLPGELDRLRERLPEITVDQAMTRARGWLDSVLEPKLKQGLESAAESVPDQTLGGILRNAAGRLGNGSDADGEVDPE
ncbi:MAG: hypothetical protein ACRDFS_12165 [Chloroflexota bacterium]